MTTGPARSSTCSAGGRMRSASSTTCDATTRRSQTGSVSPSASWKATGGTPVREDLPSGTVTLLFTDVEGSTKLLHELGAEGYAQALAEHRRLLRGAFRAHDGLEIDTQGDAFFVV